MRKKKNILIMLLVCLILLCTHILDGCSYQLGSDSSYETPNNDWSYELSNDYVIWRINSRKIVFGKKSTENSIKNIVEDYITKFCYNEEIICLQCVDVPEDISKEIDESNPKFYIINISNEAVIGPLFENEFSEKLSSFKINNLTTWISTKPKPDGAKIP